MNTRQFPFTPHPDGRREQYFFDDETCRWLFNRLGDSRDVLCLCCPRLAWEFHVRGDRRNVTLMDCDERFSSIPGFVPVDLSIESVPEGKWDAVVWDPPALRFAPETIITRLGELAVAADLLLLAYPQDLYTRISGKLSPLGMQELSRRPAYQVRNRFNRNRMRFYGRWRESEE